MIGERGINLVGKGFQGVAALDEKMPNSMNVMRSYSLSTVQAIVPMFLGLALEAIGGFGKDWAKDNYLVEKDEPDRYSNENFWINAAVYKSFIAMEVAGKIFQNAVFAVGVGYSFATVTLLPVVGWATFAISLIVTSTTQMLVEFVPEKTPGYSIIQNVHNVSYIIVKVAGIGVSTIGGAVAGFSVGLIPGAVTGAAIVLFPQLLLVLGKVAIPVIKETLEDFGL